MTEHHKKIDHRPFQSKADCQRRDSLEAQYGKLAIPEVVAALQQRSANEDRDSSNKQMR